MFLPHAFYAHISKLESRDFLACLNHSSLKNWDCIAFSTFYWNTDRNTDTEVKFECGSILLCIVSVFHDSCKILSSTNTRTPNLELDQNVSCLQGKLYMNGNLTLQLLLNMYWLEKRFCVSLRESFLDWFLALSPWSKNISVNSTLFSIEEYLRWHISIWIQSQPCHIFETEYLVLKALTFDAPHYQILRRDNQSNLLSKWKVFWESNLQPLISVVSEPFLSLGCPRFLHIICCVLFLGIALLLCVSGCKRSLREFVETWPRILLSFIRNSVWRNSDWKEDSLFNPSFLLANKAHKVFHFLLLFQSVK